MPPGNAIEQAILERIASADLELGELYIVLEDTKLDFSGRVEQENQKLDIFETEMREDMRQLAEELNIAGVNITICEFNMEQNISSFVTDASTSLTVITIISKQKLTV